MNIIVAADKNWGIGKDNKLLVSIPADMKFFRETTTGNVVVMGRKTLESFPGGLPLKRRTNIVLTKDVNYQVKDAVLVHSVEELLEELKKYDSENVYVIGGDSVYRQLLPYCDIAHVTKLPANLFFAFSHISGKLLNLTVSTSAQSGTKPSKMVHHSVQPQSPRQYKSSRACDQQHDHTDDQTASRRQSAKKSHQYSQSRKASESQKHSSCHNFHNSLGLWTAGSGI